MALVLRSVTIGVRSLNLGGASSGGGGIAGVSRDATNLNYYPASSGEWTLLMSAAGIGSGNPTSVWLAQEASGSLVDSIGSVTLDQAGTAPSYRQSIAGATRLGVRWADNSINSAMLNTTTAPVPSTTSRFQLAYLDFPAAPPGNREVMRTANDQALSWRISDGILRIITSGAVVGSVPLVSTVGWVGLRANVTAGTITAFSEQEKFSGTFTASNTNRFTDLGGQGGAGGPASAIGYAYACLFTGAAAELSDAQVKTLLQTLGATIPWT